MRKTSEKNKIAKLPRRKNERTLKTARISEMDGASLAHQLAEIKICSEKTSSDDESDASCPKCGALYSDIGGLWVQCDNCDEWYDLNCTNIKTRKVPKVYYFEEMHCLTYFECDS